MTKSLHKAIMGRSGLENKYLKNSNTENKAKYKKQKNFLVNFIKRNGKNSTQTYNYIR